MTNDEIIKRMNDIVKIIDDNVNNTQNYIKNNNKDIQSVNQCVKDMEYPYDYCYFMGSPYKKMTTAIDYMSKFAVYDCEMRNNLLWEEYHDLENELNNRE